MSILRESATPTRGFWIISVFALGWNLMGVATYLMSVTIGPETLSAMPEAERALYADIPVWVTVAYAIAVLGGTLASLALLLRKAWASPIFVISLIAIIVQMAHAFFGSAMIEVQGATAAILPILIIAIAVYLVGFTNSAKTKGWLG